jgi:hypothetical protein
VKPSFHKQAAPVFSSIRPAPILTAMRAAILILTLFCALISGWTASLARVQDLGGMLATHQMSARSGHAMHASANRDECVAETKSCKHHPQTVHPLLCAACFAVVLDTHDLARDELANSTIRPRPQKPLHPTALEPQFPPPKTFLSIS